MTQPASPTPLRRRRRKPLWMTAVIVVAWAVAAAATIGFALQLFRQRPAAVTVTPEVTITRPETPPAGQPGQDASQPPGEAGSQPPVPVPAAEPPMSSPPEEMPSLTEDMPSETEAMEMPSAMEEPSATATPSVPATPPASTTPFPPTAPPAVTTPSAPPASRTTSPPSTPTVDVAKQGAFVRALDAARKLISENNLAGARSHLETATATVQTEEEKAELERVETLLGYVEEFWKVVHKRIAGLTAGEELKIGDTVILVVEASPEQIVLRAGGRNYSYAVADLPRSVVFHLAETGLAKEPASKVFLGCYLMVDLKGDRSRARQLFEEAAQGGIDVSDMLAELSIAPPAVPSSNGKPAATGATSSNRSLAPSVASKVAVPTDEARLRQAADQVREIFRAEYAEATTPARQASLATKLLEKAEPLTDDPVGRFVMLDEARDLAVAAGEPALACKAVEQLGIAYELDALAMGASVVESVAANVRSPDGQRQVAEAALELVNQLIERDRIEEAKPLVDLAQGAAMKAKNIGLVRSAKAAGEKLEARGRRKD